jgi:hypothetical protein
MAWPRLLWYANELRLRSTRAKCIRDNGYAVGDIVYYRDVLTNTNYKAEIVNIGANYCLSLRFIDKFRKKSVTCNPLSVTYRRASPAASWLRNSNLLTLTP